MSMLLRAIAAVVLVAAAPSLAYSTRYEVRHYPAAFTRTVNDVLGNNVENYADGSVAIDFGTNPAPSLSVIATQGGTTAFDIDASYEFAVDVKPTTAAAQAYLVFLGQHPSHSKISEATGYITISEPKIFGTRVTANVGQSGYDVEVGCENGTIGQCSKSYYHTSMFIDAAAANPYLCGSAGCPVLPFGTAITLDFSMISHVQVYGGPGSHASVLIDPVIALDADFLRDAGLSASDFTISPEAGFGNTATASVPEPAIWMSMIAGFGLVGVMRRRRISVSA